MTKSYPSVRRFALTSHQRELFQINSSLALELTELELD
jgi:hypothetical protein